MSKSLEELEREYLLIKKKKIKQLQAKAKHNKQLLRDDLNEYRLRSKTSERLLKGKSINYAEFLDIVHYLNVDQRVHSFWEGKSFCITEGCQKVYDNIFFYDRGIKWLYNYCDSCRKEQDKEMLANMNYDIEEFDRQIAELKAQKLEDLEELPEPPKAEVQASPKITTKEFIEVKD